MKKIYFRDLLKSLFLQGFQKNRTIFGMTLLICAFGCATGTTRNRNPSNLQVPQQIAAQPLNSWDCTSTTPDDPLATSLEVMFYLSGTQVVGKNLEPGVVPSTDTNITGTGWVNFSNETSKIKGPAAIVGDHIRFEIDWAASQDDDEDYIKYDLDINTKKLTVNDTYVSDDIAGGKRHHTQIFDCVYGPTPH